MDTRSLSISSFGFPDGGLRENSTNNIALLFYENPDGKISALLHRLINIVNPRTGSYQQDQWIDITSQESKVLPNEFHNDPGFNYSNTLYKQSPYNTVFSKTLDEADPIAVYNTPFFSVPSSTGSVVAMFYSPFNLLPNAPSPAGNSFFTAYYTIGPNGSGSFSLVGIGKDCASPHTERPL